VTDNNLMARQCLLKMFDNECASISYKWVFIQVQCFFH
jgi:hypothetical protein